MDPFGLLISDILWNGELNQMISWIFFNCKMLWYWEVGQLSENLLHPPPDLLSDQFMEWIVLLKSVCWNISSLNGCPVKFTKYSVLSVCLRTSFPNYQLSKICLYLPTYNIYHKSQCIALLQKLLKFLVGSIN